MSTRDWGRKAGQSARAKAQTAGAGAHSWNTGAEGEEHVGRLLTALDARYWTVVHDLQLDRNWNLDHLVIGPTGVFAIDTKNLSGTVEVNGADISHNGFLKDYIEKMTVAVQKVRQNLLAATEWESLWVQGVLAFVGTRMEIQQFPNNVAIVGANNLVSVLRDWNGNLSPKQRRVLSNAAHNPLTWG